jgi:RNA polymerase sigma factor (sigma-70 family)
MDDAILLNQFVRERSDAAFEALMRRHAGLVYSAALRQTSDPHLAEDVTQAVFIVLSRKAATLSSHAVLSAWLLTTTRLTIINLRRQQALRRRVEQTSAAMGETIQMPAGPDDWSHVAPLLDETIAELNEADRAAVVLRFFEQCSLADVGKSLGVSAGAAEKRVARALDKLRRSFARRGVSIAGFALAALLTEHAVSAAPAALSAALPATVAAANAGVHGSTALATANTIIKVMAMTHAKQLALCALFFLSVGVAGGSALYFWMLKPAATTQVVSSSQAPDASIPPAPSQERDDIPAVQEIQNPATKAPTAIQPVVPGAPEPVVAPQVNLLARVDVADTVNGNWTIEDGELLSDRTSYSRFEIPYVPPQEYDFRVAFTMLEPRDEISMVCVYRAVQFAWKFGSHGNSVMAIDQNGSEVAGTRVSLAQKFEAGQRYELMVKVRNGGTAAYVNNQLLCTYQTDYRNLGLNMFWKLPNKNTLGVGTWGTRVRFHTIDIVEVAGRGHFLRAEGQPAIAKAKPALLPEERWKDAVDLLALIDPARDAVAGKWWTWKRGAAGGVSCSAGPAMRLEIPYQPPQEYDLKVELIRDSGKQDLDLILGRDGKALSWMIGRDNLTTGFQLWSRTSDFINNPTVARIPNCLTNGRTYTVVIQMRRNSFCSFIDGVLVSSFDVGDSFGVLKGWTMPTPGLLGIGANQSSATFHSIKLLELSGKGHPVEANPNRVPQEMTETIQRPVKRLVDPDAEQKPQKPPKAPNTEF